MNGRIFFAILCGGIIGGAFVHALAGQAQWYFLGVPLGGAVAWLTYTWRDIKQHAPAVWRSVFGWEPDIERYQAIGAYAFWCLMVGASFASNILLVTVAVALIGDLPLMYAVNFTSFVAGAFFVVGVGIASASDTLGEGKRPSVFRIRAVTKMKRRAVWLVSPVGVVCLFGEACVLVLRNLPVISRFLVTLFVRVHSHDALDCFFYGAVGVLIGALATQTIWVMAISAAAGVGLAFVFRMLARWVKTQWPEFA